MKGKKEVQIDMKSTKRKILPMLLIELQRTESTAKRTNREWQEEIGVHLFEIDHGYTEIDLCTDGK